MRDEPETLELLRDAVSEYRELRSMLARVAERRDQLVSDAYSAGFTDDQIRQALR